MMGDIDEKISADFVKFMDFVEEINKFAPITIKIMSDGGDWHNALAIYDRLVATPCPTTVIGMGLVGSSATAVFQAGEKRLIYPNCVFLIHDGQEVFNGEVKAFETHALQAKKDRERLYKIYASRTGRPIDFWEGACSSDAFFDSQEILDVGLADGILGANGDIRRDEK